MGVQAVSRGGDRLAPIASALIVGGGIAGLSAAIALSRRGIRCEVLEIADAPLGASLALSGRATDALADLGVYERSYETGRPFPDDTTALTLHTADGRVLDGAPRRPPRPGGRLNIAVYRPTFLEILAEAARAAGATLRRGLTVDAVEDPPGSDAASVTFSDGTAGRFECVIGADGIGSRVRSLVFPDAPGPSYAGQWSLRWMVPGPAIEDEGFYLGPLGRVGFYYLPRQDLVYVPSVVALPAGTRLTADEAYALFTELLDSYTAPAMLELRRRLGPGAALIARPFEWILVPGPWFRGRALLLGDAAHATTAHLGMGGGMAIEDGVVLGECLEGAGSLADAYRTFMTRRADRVRGMVEGSVQLSRLEQEQAPPSASRAVMVAALTRLAEPY